MSAYGIGFPGVPFWPHPDGRCTRWHALCIVDIVDLSQVRALAHICRHLPPEDSFILQRAHSCEHPPSAGYCAGLRLGIPPRRSVELWTSLCHLRPPSRPSSARHHRHPGRLSPCSSFTRALHTEASLYLRPSRFAQRSVDIRSSTRVFMGTYLKSTPGCEK